MEFQAIHIFFATKGTNDTQKKHRFIFFILVIQFANKADGH